MNRRELLERFQSLRQRLHGLLSAHTTPARLGASVGLGVLIGTTPFFGLHAWLAAGLAAVLRLNPAVCALASGYSLPPLVPVLIFTSIQTGHLLHTGEWMAVSLTKVRVIDPYELGVFWLSGSVLVGAGLGAITGGVTTWLAHRRRCKTTGIENSNDG